MVSRTMAVLTFLLICLIVLSCRGGRVEWEESVVLSRDGGEVSKGEVRLEIPQGALKEEVEIHLEKRTRPSWGLPEGYTLVGDVLEIRPGGTGFHEAAKVTLSYREERIPKGMGEELVSIAYHNGEGWVNMGDSRVDTLENNVSCQIYHTVELATLCRVRAYGMVEHRFEHGKTPVILIGGATSVGWGGLKAFLQKSNYPNPIWVFEYPVNQGIRSAASLLSAELAELHRSYGDFRMNIVGHDVGGLVGLYYALKEELYNDDIEKTLITVGTPHGGTSMAIRATPSELIEKVEESGWMLTPRDVDILFAFADALGHGGRELLEGSELLGELRQLYREHRKRCADYSKEVEPLFRIECFSGDRAFPLSADIGSIVPGCPPEIVSGEGDSYVSVESTKLSPIENAPFHKSHWELLRDERVWQDILGYLQLELFSWPLLFQDISSAEGRAKIVETWEKEFKLNQNDSRSFRLILSFGENLLNSCGPDAILFTNGDNDTYPLWWVQEKEGLRKDVAVVNLSLLNTAVFIKYMKGAPHWLPMSFTDDEIESLRPIKAGGKPVYVSEQVVDDLIRENDWERPIYYATTCRRDYLREPHSLEGLVYRLLDEGGGTEVDVEACRRNLYEVYSYQELVDERGETVDGLDLDIEKVLCRNYSAIHFQTGQALMEKGDLEGATMEFKQMIRLLPKSVFVRSVVADQYEEMGRLEEAEAELKVAMALDKDHFPARRSLASIYRKTGRETEGVKLLAKWLERYPEDEDAIDFLKEYTEQGDSTE